MRAKPGPDLGTLCTMMVEAFMIWLSLGPLLEMNDVHPPGSTISSAPAQTFQRSGNVMRLPQITGWQVATHVAWRRHAVGTPSARRRHAVGTPSDVRGAMLRNVLPAARPWPRASRGCVRYFAERPA